MRKRVKTMTTSLYEDSLMLADQQHTSLSSDGVPVMRRVVGDSMSDAVHLLQFAFLGCEEAVGYGPIEHTASLFLDLLCLAAESSNPHDLWTVSVHVYNAKRQEYPTSFEDFTGVILPGAYASAYEENVPWIEKMKQVIQQVIIPQKIPTLGICFGHQIIAQSFFPHGKVSKLSTAPQLTIPCKVRTGRVSLRASQTGQRLLGKAAMDFYVTHGDYVEKLPETAVSLGGDEMVPIQAAAYFATEQEAQQAERVFSYQGGETAARPYAITFQSHLEYASSRDLGLHRTLELIMDQMVNRGDLSHDQNYNIQQDSRATYPQVERDSVETMVMTGRLLGWFPSSDLM